MLGSRPFLTLTRWYEWGPDKISFFLNFFFFIALQNRLFSSRFRYDFFVLIGFLCTLAVYGYLVNDLGDRASDRLIGKRNVFDALPSGTATSVFILVLLSMFFCGTRFVCQRWFTALWVSQIFLATVYSLPPLRLKGRGWSGLAVNVSAQFTLPTALVFAAFGCFPSLEMILFAVCATLIWVAPEMGHQRWHLKMDRLAGIETLAVRQGYDQISRQYAFCLGLSRFAIGLLMVGFMVGIPWVSMPAIHLRLPSVLPLGVFYLILIRKCQKVQIPGPELSSANDPYCLEEGRNPYNILHAVFPNIICPFYLSGLLMCHEWHNVILVIFLFFWVFPTITRGKLAEVLKALFKREK